MAPVDSSMSHESVAARYDKQAHKVLKLDVENSDRPRLWVELSTRCTCLGKYRRVAIAFSVG